MRILFRRALCVLLCLCLMLPGFALADGDASGVRFDLRFQMDPLAFPPAQRRTLSGIADLINIMSLQGTLEMAYNGCFDLNAALRLKDEPDTHTTLRLYGNESHWNVESNLLGSEKLMINMIAALEFALKAYYHLDIPVQRLAMFISPYVHTSAFEALISTWRGVMGAQSGPRVIARADLLSLAEQLSAVAADDRAFRVWTQALALEAGYDEAIMEVMTTLPEWAETFLAEEGLEIAISGDTETWRTGDLTLFTRTVEDSVTAWSVTPPATLNGYHLNLFYKGQPNGRHVLHIHITDAYEDTVVNCDLEAVNIPNLTCEVPISAPFSLSADLNGIFLEAPVSLRFAGEGAEGQFTLSMLHPQTSQPQLTLTGTLVPYTPESVPAYTTEELLTGVNLLSINDESLTRLVSGVASPMLRGIFPLMVHMPASSVQSILDLLTESGIIDFVFNGGSSVEEEYYD